MTQHVIDPHPHRDQSEKRSGFVVWLTGLSGAGKTTIALALEAELLARGLPVERLDGDVVRESLTRDLGFSREDRDKNVERVGFVARLLARNGVGVVAAFISPYRDARDKLRAEINNFIEVYVEAPLETCIARDVKGLYAKALAGQVSHFTGVDDPYEAPENPALIIHTAQRSVAESVAQIVNYLESRDLISVALPELKG